MRNFFSAAFIEPNFSLLTTAVEEDSSGQELTPGESRKLLLSFRRDILHGLVVLLQVVFEVEIDHVRLAQVFLLFHVYFGVVELLDFVVDAGSHWSGTSHGGSHFTSDYLGDRLSNSVHFGALRAYSVAVHHLLWAFFF